MELIEKLGIDWKLLITQIINFFILLFVLYKFVYKPVLQLLEKRSKAIEKGIHDAKKSEELLQTIEKIRDEKIKQTNLEIGRMLEKASADAENIGNEILRRAKEEQEELIRNAKLQIAEEKAKLLENLRGEIISLVMITASRILEREFTDEDQKRLQGNILDVIARSVATKQS